MKMIVGLGNPGKKYSATKHNVGFMAVDLLAEKNQTSFKKNPFEAEVAEFFLGGEKVLLVKPQTFMNESGRAVGPLMTYYGLTLEDVLVIYDDLDLALGKIRLRQKGSAGGHNGMKSLISHLGSNVFARIKIGIDRPLVNQSVVSHVLSPFAKENQVIIATSVADACAACEDYLANQDFVQTMNKFN